MPNTDIDVDGLLPCPACESEVVAVGRLTEPTMVDGCQACCGSCGVCGPERPNEALARQSWNDMPRALQPTDAGVEPAAGWKLVPVEPTEAMTKAGFDPFIASHDPFFNKNEPCAPIYRAMVAAAPASPEAGVAVGVKPLEWFENGSWWEQANTIMGPYIVGVSKATAHPGWYWRQGGDTTVLPTKEEAKAAAQADYTARILGALASLTVEREAVLEWKHDAPFITENTKPDGKRWVEVQVHSLKALHDAADLIISAFKAAGAK